jgi:hypothetical protein
VTVKLSTIVIPNDSGSKTLTVTVKDVLDETGDVDLNAKVT